MFDRSVRIFAGSSLLPLFLYDAMKMFTGPRPMAGFDDIMLHKRVVYESVYQHKDLKECYRLNLNTASKKYRTQRQLVAAGEQEVLTSLGWKQLKDITSEDEVCVYDYHGIRYQRPHSVTKLTRRRKVYGIEHEPCFGFVANTFIVR